VLDAFWKTLEREVRILVPYQRLAAGNAAGEMSVLVDVAGQPATSIWGSLRRGEWVHVMVAGAAVLSDVLIIAVGGVPLADAQILEVFRWSVWVSLAVMAWMVGTLGVVVFRWRGEVRRLGMPREPATVLGVALMLVDEGNGVVGEFWENGVVSSGRERDRRARKRGNRYFAGWQEEGDGRKRWCVGVEPGVPSAATSLWRGGS
jgi:hypothetical protein